MSNFYFQGSVSKADSEDKTVLIRIFLEQLQEANINIVSKEDVINAIEIGLSSFYPYIAISIGEKLDDIIEKMIKNNIINFTEENKKIQVIPASLDEKLKFKRVEYFEFKRFISFLVKFTNKRAKAQLARNVKSVDEKNSLLLEFYAFLSYIYALYVYELGSTVPVYFKAEIINDIADNLFERAYEMDKEFIICCNVTELVKNYFVCIKFLVDSYIPE